MYFIMRLRVENHYGRMWTYMTGLLQASSLEPLTMHILASLREQIKIILLLSMKKT